MLIMRSPDARIQKWPEHIIESWCEHRETHNIVVNITTDACGADFVDLPKWLSSKTKLALERAGIPLPYSHQVEAWQAAKQGRNYVVATPTASGKTLCYNVPVINRILEELESRALYLFPTKALSRDQEEAIKYFAQQAEVDASVFVYDGDTPADSRRAARRGARVLITNPDMLHMGILPHHASWAEFFAGLSFVVIDELHAYRGVFGSHVSNVVRRLNRISSFYGSSPVFATCSATIANPRELAEIITGQPFELLDQSGAPEGPKTFAVYNPEVIDADRGIRRSFLEEASRLAGDIVATGRKTLVFCQTRRGVEIVLRYLRDRLIGMGGDPERVRGYRGGYLPLVRREIEEALKGGELDAVVATNALELGIDIGSLDAVVMAGYPGTIAGLRQRAGRAGRRQDPSLAVLVTTASPLDQYLAREPRYLTETSAEQALAEPDNIEILLSHLGCAAFELPFKNGETFGNLSPEDTEAALRCLEEEGLLALSSGRYYYIAESYPAADISLRNISSRRVVVVDRENQEPIAEVDSRAARIELHEEAVYLSQGTTYRVETLDLESGKALVSEMEPVYYTTPRCNVSVEVVEELEERALRGGVVASGEARVTEIVMGFKKIRFHTHENLGFGEVDLPPEQMDTEACWLTLSPRLYALLEEYHGSPLLRGLDGFGYAVHQVASLHLMCDPHDIAISVQAAPDCDPDSETEAVPALFFYDTHAGGVGLSQRMFREMDIILHSAGRLIEGCACKQGCPSCIGPFEEGAAVVKEVAAALSRGLLGPATVA